MWTLLDQKNQIVTHIKRIHPRMETVFWGGRIFIKIDDTQFKELPDE